MVVTLGRRNVKTVETFWHKVRTPEIMRTLPLEDQTLEQALEDYRRTLLPGATSYGRTILLDGAYAGDVWCYNDHRKVKTNVFAAKRHVWQQMIRGSFARCSL